MIKIDTTQLIGINPFIQHFQKILTFELNEALIFHIFLGVLLLADLRCIGSNFDMF